MSDRDSYSEIILGGTRFKLRSPLAESNLSTFQRKLVIGDYTQDSNPLLSAWVISDLSGGHGVEDLNESSDATRYRIGTFYTRFPAQISKQYKINTEAKNGAWPATGTPRVVGDILKAAGGWETLITIDAKVWSLTTPGALIGNMTVEPQAPALQWGNELMIPMGIFGYAYIDDSPTLTNIAASGTVPAAMSFAKWDNKAFAINNQGHIWFTADPTPTPTWTDTGIVVNPTGGTDRRLVSYFDRNGNPALFVMTDTEVLQLNIDDATAFSIGVEFPFHPDNKIATASWRGDLYFTAYNGVHRYTGGSLSAMGLDRDSGLPAEYAGPIYDMVPGYNALYASVTKPSLSGFTFPGGTPTTQNSVHEWTGTGWHMLWESSTENMVRNSMKITRGADTYRLYWTVSNNYVIYYIDLPRKFANPRERSRATGGFNTNGYLETGIFDASMKGYTKVASALDVSIRSIDASAVLTVKYKVNDASSWTTLGTVTTTGVTTLPFGTLANGIYPGVLFERIKLRFELADSSNEAFVMESAVLSFVKTVPPSYAFTAQVDLSYEYDGKSPQVLRAAIDSLLSARVFVPLVFRGVTYRVLLSQVGGASESGTDETSSRQLSILEVPLTLGGS